MRLAAVTDFRAPAPDGRRGGRAAFNRRERRGAPLSPTPGQEDIR